MLRSSWLDIWCDFCSLSNMSTSQTISYIFQKYDEVCNERLPRTCLKKIMPFKRCTKYERPNNRFDMTNN